MSSKCRAKIRKDLWVKGQYPSVMPMWTLDILGWLDFFSAKKQDFKFEYANLEEDTGDGYNIVIWDETKDFVALANSIDFEFVEEDIDNE